MLWDIYRTRFQSRYLYHDTQQRERQSERAQCCSLSSVVSADTFPKEAQNLDCTWLYSSACYPLRTSRVYARRCPSIVLRDTESSGIRTCSACAKHRSSRIDRPFSGDTHKSRLHRVMSQPVPRGHTRPSTRFHCAPKSPDSWRGRASCTEW